MWRITSPVQIFLIALLTIVCAMAIVASRAFGKIPAFFRLVSAVWAFSVNWVTGMKIDIVNKHNMHLNKPCIYVANHSSYFDITAAFQSIPVPLHFVAKKEIKKVPFMGWAMQAANMIFIDRQNRIKAMESMKKAGELVAKGNHVITFPEGTRSATGEVAMFKRGSFIMALAGNVDVVPVAIVGARAMLPKGSFTIKPGRVEVRFGEPLRASDFDTNDPNEFANVARNKVVELLEQ